MPSHGNCDSDSCPPLIIGFSIRAETYVQGILLRLEIGVVVGMCLGMRGLV